ncbi:hypothetical protein [uncultured Lacinutrix sp.]|uniref:hypothetical protein n=1 Tax=uncultured Lacinutrix sp. TaxID=574032 RepID=UPI00261EA33A|nr:hypothetical protein [uncultured Lacinutrix sp.]
MEFVSHYLQSERLLGLSTGIIGVLSIIIGLFFLLTKPQFKAFAITMLIIGTIEAGVFITGYFIVNNETKVNSKIEVYENAPKDYLEKDKIVIERNLKLFFILKCIYGSLFLILAIILSKATLKPQYFGILTALMIHFAIAVVIDTFGEHYTKNYQKEINKQLNI